MDIILQPQPDRWMGGRAGIGHALSVPCPARVAHVHLGHSLTEVCRGVTCDKAYLPGTRLWDNSRFFCEQDTGDMSSLVGFT